LLYARFGTYLAAVGMDAQAHDALGKALQLNARRLESVARQFAPGMLSATFASRREILGVYLSFALTQHPQHADVMRKLAGDAMQSKGLESDMLAELNRAIALSRDTEVQHLRRSMGEAPPNSPERMNLGAALQGKVASLMQPLRFEDGNLFLDRVSARIGDATLISVLQFRPFDFRQQQFDAPRYLGLLLARGKMRAVDIGLASEINGLAARARSEMARPANSVAANPALAKALYASVLQPLIGPNMPPGPYIADMDGAINMLPLETLVDGTGRYLIEQASWTYISSARAMLRKQDRAAPSNAALVIVNPDFNGGVSAKSDPATLAFFQNSTATRAADGTVSSSVSFNPLPETMDEGRAVAAAMRRMNSQVAILSGADVTSSALQGAHAPRFLHIATHGFFLEDAGTVRQYGTSKDGRRYTLAARDPGLNSGLALAGANNTISSGHGEGILFSSQIRQLDLQGTELVVLSACDTGVGTVKVGEGVESLRQALELAGARSSVTSLWKVPSLATRDLMVGFYDAMASGASKPEALRQAKIRLMKTSPQPFYWGGFVMSGID
jgi:CHAT domain-containing protein